MNDSDDKVLNYSISDYLDLHYKKNIDEKLVLLITPNQTAYMKGEAFDHWPKMVKLSRVLFPNGGYDKNYNSAYEGGVWIFSNGELVDIYVPGEINKVQYQCLEEILADISKYEKENNVHVLEEDFTVESILSEAKTHVTNKEEELGEVILTEPIITKNQINIEEETFGRPHNFENVKVKNPEKEDLSYLSPLPFDDKLNLPEDKKEEINSKIKKMVEREENKNTATISPEKGFTESSAVWYPTNSKERIR